MISSDDVLDVTSGISAKAQGGVAHACSSDVFASVANFVDIVFSFDSVVDLCFSCDPMVTVSILSLCLWIQRPLGC